MVGSGTSSSAAWFFRSSGVPWAISLPRYTSPMRSQYSASSMKWVVTITVTPFSTMLLMCSQNSRRVMGSTPDVGSSRNRISGSCISEQASASRCLKPSGSSSVAWEAMLVKAKASLMRRIFSFCARPRRPYTPEKKRRFCSTVRLPYRENFCAIYPRCWRALPELTFRSISSTSALPDVGTSRPHIILKVVDFPAPFGPSRPKISPRFTEKLTLSVAAKSPNFLVRDLASITVSPGVPSTVCKMAASGDSEVPAPPSRSINASSKRGAVSSISISGMPGAWRISSTVASFLRITRTERPWIIPSLTCGSLSTRCSSLRLDSCGLCSRKLRPAMLCVSVVGSP